MSFISITTEYAIVNFSAGFRVRPDGCITIDPGSHFNGGIIAGKVRHVLENTEYNIGYDTNLKIKPIFMSKEESVDIDDPIDLELCRLMAGDYDK